MQYTSNIMHFLDTSYRRPLLAPGHRHRRQNISTTKEIRVIATMLKREEQQHLVLLLTIFSFICYSPLFISTLLTTKQIYYYHHKSLGHVYSKELNLDLPTAKRRLSTSTEPTLVFHLATISKYAIVSSCGRSKMANLF